MILQKTQCLALTFLNAALFSTYVYIGPPVNQNAQSKSLCMDGTVFIQEDGYSGSCIPAYLADSTGPI